MKIDFERFLKLLSNEGIIFVDLNCLGSVSLDNCMIDVEYIEDRIKEEGINKFKVKKDEKNRTEYKK